MSTAQAARRIIGAIAGKGETICVMWHGLSPCHITQMVSPLPAIAPIILLAACAVLMVLEWRGVRTTLELQFKGDVKRETRWLAQYGQSVCTPIAALLVYQLDPGGDAPRLHRG